jgi:hypothetical protein
LENGARKEAFILPKNARFNGVRDVNAETHNHPFGDVYAKRGPGFVIGVKARNRYQKSGPFNASYNILKRGCDILAKIGKRY